MTAGLMGLTLRLHPGTAPDDSQAKVHILIYAAKRERTSAALAEILAHHGYVTQIVESATEAREALEHSPFQVVIPTNFGIAADAIPDFIAKVKPLCPEAGFLVASGELQPEMTAVLSQLGVEDILGVPFNAGDVYRRVQALLLKKGYIRSPTPASNRPHTAPSKPTDGQ